MKETRVQYYIPPDIKGLELLSCSDADYHFAPHFHDSYCLWINSSSAEAYTHQGQSGLLAVGDIGIIAPGEVHSNNAFDTDTRQLLTFYLAPSTLCDIAAEIFDKSDSSTEIPTAFHGDNQLFDGLFSLWQILRRSDSVLERQSAFYNTLGPLISRYAAGGCREIRAGHEQVRVAKVIDLLHAHFATDIRLDTLAHLVDCTPYHLIRFFKKAVGMTPHAYLIQLRLEQARTLLQQGVSVVDVAMAAGFTDQSHLTRHFKQKFGVTPGSYRRQVLSS